MANDTDTFFIRDKLAPEIDKAFKNKSNIRDLLRGIQRYSDRWSNLLLSINFSNRLLINDNDKSLLNKCTGISNDTIKAAIKEVPFIEPNWNDANNTFYHLSLQLARWFRINKMQNEKMAIMMYMGYALYSSVHYNSFKYLPKKEVMEYTINDLSNRFNIKKLGTIYACIEHTIGTAINGILDEPLMRLSDSDACDIIDALHTRMRSFMVNIASEFYKNNASGAYLNHNSEDYSEENFRLNDSVTLKISRLSTSISTSIVSDGFDYNKCIKRSIRMNSGVSEKKLVAMIDTIVENDTPGIKDMVSNILTLFVYKGTGNRVEEIGSTKFLSEAMQIYKSNAQDDITKKVKDKLLEWIDMSSEKYGRNFISRGKTSLDTYRRAIYTVFVFKIMSVVNK